MPLSWDLILRFTLGGGQRRFTRFVALASLLGMMLGVAALITVLSVMNGFGGELHQRLLTVTPDMVLEPANPSEAALSELLMAATEQSAVVAATPFHQGTALLRHAGQSRGVQVVGAPESGLRDVIDLDSHITFGDLQALEREPFSVILGADLARLLRVRPGDNVDILLPRLTVSPMGVFPKSRSLRVVGTFAVGAPPDAQVAYVAEATASKLLGPAGMQGIQLRLNDRERVSELSAAIRPRVDASTQIRISARASPKPHTTRRAAQIAARRLRAECRKRGLRTLGLKRELVERLEETQGADVEEQEPNRLLLETVTSFLKRLLKASTNSHDLTY